MSKKNFVLFAKLYHKLIVVGSCSHGIQDKIYRVGSCSLMRQKYHWSYCAFSRIRLLELVT